jgi:hypothetical protein
MPSIVDLIVEHETAAAKTAKALREQIAELTDRLAIVETELTELAITRRTLLRLTSQTASTTPDTLVSSGPYPQILTVFATATGGIRAKDVCLAMYSEATPRDVDKMRVRLKRLATHQILTELEPGLFALAQPDSTTNTNRDQDT